MISARWAAHVRWLRKGPPPHMDVPVEQRHFRIRGPVLPIVPEPIIGMHGPRAADDAEKRQHESQLAARPAPSERDQGRSPASDAGNKGRYIRIAERDRAIADHLADEARDDDGDQTRRPQRG